MRVDDARYGGHALTEIPWNRKIVGAVAHRPDVDLRRQSEIQDLRYDIGRLEIEGVFRECGGQDLTQLLDVSGCRLVALLECYLDDAIVDPDGRAVGECQIVGSRRQSNIVDHQGAVLLRNDLANLVLDRLENRLGAFDAGAGGSPNGEVELAPLDPREESPAQQHQDQPAQTNPHHFHHREAYYPAKHTAH